MPVVKQQKDAAAALGVTATALRQWMAQPGFPDCAHGYDIEAIEAWRARKDRKGAQQSDQQDQLKLAILAQTLKRKKLDNEIRELDLRTKEGELLPRRGWELFAAELLTQLGDLAEQLPDLIARICPEDVAPKVRARLKQELDQWRHDAAEALASGPKEHRHKTK